MARKKKRAAFAAMGTCARFAFNFEKYFSSMSGNRLGLGEVCYA